ncbi:MAG: hypothetical protein J6P20_10025 [Oscillospiraceae bacterium]|nr:hypothetical protein [Oscillospiraceae bacterium]
MHEIIVSVREKIAQVQGSPEIVCGNSDYTVTFDLDSEWAPYDAKTAQFKFFENGVPRCYEVAFTGDSAPVPAVYDTGELLIGVYAGDIRTSTPARVPCLPCISDGTVPHPDPPPDVYQQLLALLETLDTGGGCVAGNAIDAAFGVISAVIAGNAESVD